MKTIRITDVAGSKTQLLWVFLVILALAGCGRNFTLKTVLNADETVQRDDAVYVDGTMAGKVRAIRLEGGLRLAELAITEPSARSRMKVGVVRNPQSGRVELLTSGVVTNAAPLAPGALIPTQSKLGFAFTKYALNQTTLIAVAAFLVALLLGLGFKKIFKSVLVLAVALPLSGLAAWVITPNVTPVVEEFYAKASVKNSADSSGSLSSDPVPSVLTKAKVIEGKLIQVLVQRPDPRVVAFSGVFLIALCVFACVTGGMIRICSA